MAAQPEVQTPPSDTKGLDRAIWIVGILLVLVVAGFVGYYYYDRYCPSSMSPSPSARSVCWRKRSQENPADLGARLAVAQWYLEQELYEQAVSQGKEALKLDPDSLEVMIVLGLAHQALGDTDQAIDNFSKVVELNKGNEFAHVDQRMNLAHYHLGDLYKQKGDYDRAVESLQAALAVNRTDADARYALALIYQAQGKHQAAIDEFNDVLRYVPEFAEIYTGLRESYAALGRTHETAYAEAMMAYFEGDYVRTVEQLQAVVHNAPDVSAAYLGLGMAYEKLGQTEEAITALQQLFGRQTPRASSANTSWDG